MSDQAEICLVDQCAGPSYARGLCRCCYESARRQIASGKRSWPELVEIGLAKDARPYIRNPFMLALQQIDGGK